MKYITMRWNAKDKTIYRIKGFIDDNINSLDGFNGFPKVLDTIDNYQVAQNDVFVTSIGSVKAKMICIKKLLHSCAQLHRPKRLYQSDKAYPKLYGYCK